MNSDNRKKVSIILPTYNEGENIGQLIKTLYDVISHPLELIVVDDTSTDNTAEVVESLDYPDIVLIRRKIRGLASAFNRGIIESTGEILCWMDADMCMPPLVLKKMIEQLDEFDIAVGSRYAKGGKDVRAPLRVYASRFINNFARFILGGNVRDYDSGFVAMKRDVLNSISLMPFGYGEYFIEMIYDAHRAGLKIVEIGYEFQDRKFGYSKSIPSLFSFIRTGSHYIFRILSLRLRFLRGGN